MAIVYLGLGSNLGDRADNIARAVTRLNQNKIQVKKLSTVIETDPVGGPKQEKFFNAVLEAQTDLSPQDLRATVKSIEKNLGRQETIRNGPRIIDIDILLYDRITVRTPQLTIPHPRMLERDFVMTPLKEIAPALASELTSRHNKELTHANHP